MSEEEILTRYHTVAIVGASSNPERPSHRVACYLVEHGYHVIPVNPREQQILGLTSYPDLDSIPEKVDIVDIFRNPKDVMPIIEAAIKIGARVIWMQEGVINEEAAARARDAGLFVAMDKCMRKEHQRLTGDRS